MLLAVLLILALWVSRREPLRTATLSPQYNATTQTEPSRVESLSPKGTAPDRCFLPSVARDEVSLNGEWDFQPCSLALEPPLPDEWERKKVHVPIPWNVNSFAADSGGDFRCFPRYPREWDTVRAGWLSRSFEVPKGLPGDRWFLRFESAAHRTVVLVNGVEVAQNEDGFTPFEVEIGEYLNPEGENQLLVGCAGWEALSANGRMAFPAGSFWGKHVVGLWQDVTLIRRQEIFLRNISITTTINPPSLELSVSLDSTSSETRQLRILHEMVPWYSDALFEPTQSRFVAADSIEIEPSAVQSHTSESTLFGAALWSPENPNLYVLRTRLLNSQGGLVDEATTRFGFREFRLEGSRFLLNGVPIRLRGDSWHYMGTLQQSKAYAQLWYQLAQETNLNVIRLHAQPHPTFYLDAADEMGMLLISETALWASGLLMKYNADFWRRYQLHLNRLVVRDRNHPSVIMWSVANEVFAAHNLDPEDGTSGHEEIATHLAEAMDILQTLDPSRIAYSDGDLDLNGRTPVYSLHYPNVLQAPEITKPLLIGEEGPMHFANPDLVALYGGDEVYTNRNAWLRAIAEHVTPFFEAHRQWSSLIAPFNTVWYSLEPLPFSEPDGSATSRLPSETLVGRVPPFSLTLNPGFDSSLPLWRPNPLHETIQDLMSPVRAFVDPVTRFYGNHATGIMIIVQNDTPERKDISLTCELIVDTTPGAFFEHHVSLEPADRQAMMMPFCPPHFEQITPAVMRYRLFDGDGDLHVQSRDITIFPGVDRLKPFHSAHSRLLYMGDDRLASHLPQHEAAERVADASLENLDIMILGYGTTPLQSELHQIRYRVEEGLRLLVLEPRKEILDCFGVASNPVFEPYQRASILAPSHPIMQGLDSTFLHQWQPDGFVGSWSLSDSPRRDARIILGANAGEDVLVEVPFGKGCVVFCACDLGKSVAGEPAASLLLNNILAYLSEYETPRTFPVHAWTSHGSALHLLLREMGLLEQQFLETLPSRLAPADGWAMPTPTDACSLEEPDPFEVWFPRGLKPHPTAPFIVDASEMIPTRQDLEWISELADSGGQILLVNLRPETQSYYEDILPSSLEMSQCTAEHLIKCGDDSLLNGMHNADIYWIEQNKHNPIMHYSISTKTLDSRVHSLLQVPQIDWRKWCWQPETVKTSALLQSTLRPEPDQVGLLVYPKGNGRILICQLIPRHDYVKCRRVFGSLLTNMNAAFGAGQ